MIQELDDVILTCDLPKQGLARGDIGTVVLLHQKGKGYEVEFTTLESAYGTETNVSVRPHGRHPLYQ